MALDVDDLRTFLEVRTRGSLTAAAKALGSSQPSLTAAMQRLERHFDTTLLVRGRTGVTLTATGLALANDAQRILEAVGEAQRRVAGIEDTETGRFVLGSHESLAAYFLPSMLSAFFVAHPGIEIDLWNGSSAAARDAVIDRRIDFAIVVNPEPHPELVLVELFDDAIDFFVCAQAPPSSRGRPRGARERALARLAAGPIFHAARVSESRILIQRLLDQGIATGRLIACGDFELVKSLTLAGAGVGILPRRVAAYHHEGALVRLDSSLPSYADRIYLAYRADAHKTRGARTLKDALVVHGRSLARAPRGL